MSEPAQSVAAASPSADSFSPAQAMLDWMQEMAPYGIFTTDHELRVRSWNRWLTEQTALASEGVMGREITEIFPDLAERRLSQPYQRALAGEVSVLATALHKHLLAIPATQRTGESQNMLQTVRIAPLRSQGRIVGTITVIEDVTQRELQSKKLLRQQGVDRMLSQSLAALLQSNDPARDIGDIVGRILPTVGADAFLFYVAEEDRQALRLNSASGVAPQHRENLARVAVLDRVPVVFRVGEGTLQQTLTAHYDTLRQAGLPQQCGYPLVCGDRLLGLLTFAGYDPKRIDDENRGVLARVARYAAVTLDRAQREREAIAASKAKDDFLAALSHELRAPLNAVLLIASDGAESEEFPHEAREAFQFIERNAMLEARLIDDLLDLTRIERDRVQLETRVLDVHRALHEAAFTVQRDVQERQITLQFDLQANPSTVEGDEVRVQQVFWNVLKNAVKFTPVGGAITVGTRADNGNLVVEFTDTGIGMDPHELSRIFSAFAQGDHAEAGGAHRFGGLGLGLAISRKLVELHGGRIEAFSQGKGKGSTFRVALPRQQPAKPRPAAGAETAKAPASAGNGGEQTRLHLLVVEDHESTRETLEKLLVRRGHRVSAVASTDAALAAAAQQRFDLVVSDIGLPDGDGYQLMSTLRDLYGLRGVALSGYGMQRDLDRSREAGFVAHLTKPIRLESLDSVIERYRAGDGSLFGTNIDRAS